MKYITDRIQSQLKVSYQKATEVLDAMEMNFSMNFSEATGKEIRDCISEAADFLNIKRS